MKEFTRMNAADIRKKMEDLKDYIDNVLTSVRDGKMVNLVGLDKNVAMLCNQALSLPPEDARDLQPLMAALISDLEQLGAALKDFKEGIKKQ